MIQRRVLFIESYDTGSHARTLDLFLAHSRHHLLPIRIPPAHWKWTSGTVHHVIENRMTPDLAAFEPDAIVLSGPMNVPAVIMSLPAGWSSLPVAYLFHESQWTYPTNDADIHHFLLGHLDAFRFADQCWFNSSFHRMSFWDAAHHHSSARIRRLSRTLLKGSWQDTRVIYPPITEPEAANVARRSRKVPRILWAARWEREKRPDRFVEVIRNLVAAGKTFDLAVLGPGAGPDPETDPLFREIAPQVAVRGPLLDRNDYEAELQRSDVVISTTDHEFFGIAMLEAALAGAVPILPEAHAYPETLPSAVFYESGDLEALTSKLFSVLDRKWGRMRPWVQDARRFLPPRTVAAFDCAVDDLARNDGKGSRITLNEH